MATTEQVKSPITLLSKRYGQRGATVDEFYVNRNTFISI